jgi:hypothetical protein
MAFFHFPREEFILRAFRCDLHIHTGRSSCVDLDMYPRALIEKSIKN